MTTRFKPVTSQVNLPQVEDEVLKYWEENKIYEKSVENRKGSERFVFYEGPPTANGKPGIHHVLVRSIKDLILRYRTMKGYLVERKAGWDTHGLPVEISVEKELGLKGKQDILNIKENEFESVKFFNEKCKESVFRYIDDWANLTKRIGFWINFDDAYVTYKNEYIESIWWFLKEVHKKGLLYKDYKVVPYCPRCGTSLSSHEVSLGYQDDTEDPSVFIKFELVDELGTYILVWTTTPWTLPGNVALAIGKNIDYVKVKQGEEKFILAKSRLEILEGDYEVVEAVKVEDLIGKSYKPLYSYLNPDKKAYFVAEADFASDEEGTGIVHTAVMYGVEDFELGKKLDLPKKHMVNLKGEFIPEVEKFAGEFVKDADTKIIEDLKERNILYKSGIIKHTYPFCWRCSTPLLYYALDAWFIKTTAVKADLLKDNQAVNWVPKTIKNGRMGNWLDTLIDWNITRNRFWGTPLPIWTCANNHIKVIGSTQEIKDLGGEVPQDLHKPYIDEVELNCSDCGEKMKRLPDVADVWMDSGAMPFAQWHYPFENEEKFKEWFPADYIVEAIDQTRGWFFTLMAEATLLGYQPPAPFKNVIVTGHVLDEKGQKMSKSKGNVVDPWEVIPVVGADTVRWYMYTATPPGGNYLFSKELVMEKYRRFTLIFWNSYKFFVEYSSLASWLPKEGADLSEEKLTTLDRWILAKMAKLISTVDDKLGKYDPNTSSRSIEDFVTEDLSTWYIRRSRDRVGPAAEKSDEEVFLATSYYVFNNLSKLLAPFMPFVAEEIYKNLTGEESVHLTNYPEADKSMIDDQLIKDMADIRKLVEIGHSLRKEANIKLRQPLGKYTYYLDRKLSEELEKIMTEELNVKEVEYRKLTGGETRGELDTKITPELAAEGETRDLIRQIQQQRKEAGLTLKDKVKVISPFVPANEGLLQMVLKQTNTTELIKGEQFKVEVI